MRREVSFFSRFPADVLDRLRAALGGAILLAVLLSLLQWWSAGVRPATMADLTRDTEAGLVDQWFPADSLSYRTGVPSRFQPTGPAITDHQISASNTGVFIVWRTKDYGFGLGHWQIASPVVDVFSPTSAAGTASNSRVQAAVDALSEAPGATRVRTSALPTDSLTGWTLALWLLAIVVFFAGRAPAVGTRWFWFWFVSSGPLAFAAYAVTELIAWRPSNWPKKRLSGLWGIALSFGVALALGAAAMFVLPWVRRTLGLAFPL